jgi:cytochrome c
MDSVVIRHIAVSLVLASSLFASAASAAGNPANGKTLFARCAVCHKVVPGTNGIGPNLFGVGGRTAGAVQGFNYSAAMKNSGIVWSDEKLIAYIEKPQSVVPGNRMPFSGLTDPTQAADLAAYLETLK